MDKRRGAYVAPAAGRVKLGEYAQAWLDSKHQLKPSTRARYQVVLDTALAKYADMAVRDISRQFIREWVSDSAPIWHRRRYTKLSAFCGRCSRWRWPTTAWC